MLGRSERIQMGLGLRINMFAVNRAGSGRAKSFFGRLFVKPPFVGPAFCWPGGRVAAWKSNSEHVYEALKKQKYDVMIVPEPQDKSEQALFAVLHLPIREENLTGQKVLFAISNKDIDPDSIVFLHGLKNVGMIKNHMEILFKATASRGTIALDNIAENIPHFMLNREHGKIFLFIDPNQYKTAVTHE